MKWIEPRVRDAQPVPGAKPTVLFEDADLVAVNKPTGWLTHTDGVGARPDVRSLVAPEGGVHQRLDVDTTGVLVFSRSSAGAKRLQAAFANRGAHKTYLAVVDGAPPAQRGTLRTPVAGKPAETRYTVLGQGTGWSLVQCEPRTGRTHQIRVHLAQAGCAIKGDGRFGDALDRRAYRTLLHCQRLVLPDGTRFEAPPPADFARYMGGSPAAARAELAADAHTTCYREVAGAADGWPGWTVDRYDDWLWVQHDEGAPVGPTPAGRGVYTLLGKRDRSRGGQRVPVLTAGVVAPQPLVVQEHGVRFRVELGEQLSTGVFLDQRPQRAWLAQHASGMRVLNLFAHAGAFSVAAAVAGAETVSVDLSKSWLARVGPQVLENGGDPSRHDTIYGDVFDWARRLAKRGEQFDLVICDPPSTSVGTRKKRWSAAKDYGTLVQLLSPLVAPGGRLWTATNHRGLSPARFAHLVQSGAPEGAWLERICPPAVDYPTDDATSVKTHVWRWPS
jgi:23S rRNA (cytosine1962-C5)-methyltransferase